MRAAFSPFLLFLLFSPSLLPSRLFSQTTFITKIDDFIAVTVDDESLRLEQVAYTFNFFDIIEGKQYKVPLNGKSYAVFDILAIRSAGQPETRTYRDEQRRTHTVTGFIIRRYRTVFSMTHTNLLFQMRAVETAQQKVISPYDLISTRRMSDFVGVWSYLLYYSAKTRFFGAFVDTGHLIPVSVEMAAYPHPQIIVHQILLLPP